MRIRHALARALLCLCVAVTCSLAFGMPASADDPAPRAVPAARGYQRAFASYDAVVAYATGIAQAQSSLDDRMAALQAALDAARAEDAALAPSTTRAGILLDFDPEPRRDAVTRRAALRSREKVLAAALQQVVTSGALTSRATAWQMPTDGVITQPFGDTDMWVEPSRVYAGIAYAHFHEGVDIAGAWAAPVVAPARGRVVFVGRMSDGAEIVVLAHDGGVVTMYAHLDDSSSPPPVRAGDEVAAGQRIGTVGLTGITTGEHLHWAAWRDGALIDPLSLLQR